MKINKKQIAYNRTARTQKPVYIVIHDIYRKHRQRRQCECTL